MNSFTARSTFLAPAIRRVALAASVEIFACACWAMVSVTGAVARSDKAPEVVAASPAAAQAIWETPVKTLTGEATTLARYRGQPLIIYFWATWCAPCQTGVPAYSALHAKHAAAGLAVVGVAIDNVDKVSAFVTEKVATNPTYVSGAPAIKLTKQLGNSSGAMPFTVFMKANGEIIEAHVGKTAPQKVDALTDTLLASSNG